MDSLSFKCEICGAKVYLENIRDGLVYNICRGCGHCLIQMTSITDEDFEKAQDLYFGANSILLQSNPSANDQEILTTRISVILGYIKSDCSVVEVGPGAGFLLREFQKRNFKLKAVEYSHVLADALRNKFGLDVVTGNFEKLTTSLGSFDAFCSFHVIEHVPSPESHLKAALEIVKPGGLGFIATPNALSWQQRWFRKLSPNFDEAHLRVFSAQSLRESCTNAGWEVIDITTPEYSIGWLRVISKAVRRMRQENETASAGKYAAVSTSRLRWIYKLISLISLPLRILQSRLGGGNELFFVLRRPAENCFLSSINEDKSSLVRKFT